MNKPRLMLCIVGLCASAYADTVVTPGPWDLYDSNGNLLQKGFSSESSCASNATSRNVTQTYTCRTQTTVAVTQATSSTQSAGGSYSTTFDLTEYPISEGGRWHKSSNPWTYVRTANGTAYGTNGLTNSYDDSYALLSGFGADYTIEAVVQVNSGTVGDSHEAELLLRFADDSSNARGYEVLFSINGTVQVVRWNGPFGNYTVLNEFGCFNTWTQASPLKTGDVIKASVAGNKIQAWINGVQKACATDGAFTSGQPGMAFFIRPGGSNNLLTLTKYTATSN